VTPTSRLVNLTADGLSISIVKVDKIVFYKGVEYAADNDFANLLNRNKDEAIVTYKSRKTRIYVDSVEVLDGFIVGYLKGYENYEFNLEEIENYLQICFGLRQGYKQRQMSNEIKVRKTFNKI